MILLFDLGSLWHKYSMRLLLYDSYQLSTIQRFSELLEIQESENEYTHDTYLDLLLCQRIPK